MHDELNKLQQLHEYFIITLMIFFLNKYNKMHVSHNFLLRILL